jgi:hypothetical protein
MSGGHTSLSWRNTKLFPELKSFEYIPFTGRLNALGEFEVTKSISIEVNVNTKIEAIAIKELYADVMTCIGGIYSFKNSYSESIFPLYLFFTNRVKAPYKLTLKNGEIIELKGLKIR